MNVREFNHDDEKAFFDMCQVFYESHAALRGYDEDIARMTFERVMDRHENLWGFMLIDKDVDEFIGYALLTSYWCNEEGGEVIVLDELLICPINRKKGYGRLFLEWLEERFSYAAALTLEVLSTNEHAKELYEKEGYSPDGYTTYTKSLKKFKTA
jgi:GNAT superfamily N-acetyltransferase